METSSSRRGHFSLLESVRCLDCGEVYSKPSDGGTVETNPGCPSCGYVGWIPVKTPATARTLRRFGADPRLVLLVRSH